MLRLVQKAHNPKGLVIGWLIGQGAEAALCKALPGYSIVADSLYTTNPTSAELIQARKLAGVDVHMPIALMGWSAGCQTVRGILLANLLKDTPLDFVMVLDGTHGAVPPLEWQVNVWRDLADRARKGEVGFIATCTQMTYTKTIPVGQPGRAMPTSEILGAALGQPLELGRPQIQGKLYAAMYPSPHGVATKAEAEASGQAHRDQVNVVAPHLLTHCVSREGWGTPAEASEPAPEAPQDAPGQADTGPATQRSTRGSDDPPPPWRDPSLPLRERALLWSENEFAQGVCEVPDGSNAGPRIDQYFSLDFHRRHPDVKLYPHALAWCAAAACYAHDACRIGAENIPRHRIAGIELEEDAKEDGTHYTDPKLIRPGDLVILHRPGEAWFRHVARIRKVSATTFSTLAGNEGNRWGAKSFPKTSKEVICFIRVD